jgi:hypothetical protein
MPTQGQVKATGRFCFSSWGICSFNPRLVVPRALALFLSGLTICYSIREYSVGILSRDLARRTETCRQVLNTDVEFM